MQRLSGLLYLAINVLTPDTRLLDHACAAHPVTGFPEALSGRQPRTQSIQAPSKPGSLGYSVRQPAARILTTALLNKETP